MIRIQDLHKSFRNQKVLDGITLDIPRGEIFVIIGGSGEGKTVLLKHIIGLLRPDRGHIYVDGEDLCHQGFDAFRWLIRKFAPRFFLHGHIHRRFDTDAERVTEVDRTKVINAYGHHLLDIEDEKDSG